MWQGFIEKAKKLLPYSDGIILDLRGNPGGDDTIAHQLRQEVLGSKYEDTPVDTIYRINHKLAFQAMQNNCLKKMQINKRLHKPVNAYIASYQSIEKEKEKYSGSGDIYRKAYPGEKFKQAKALYKKPIISLIDRETGSSGETTTLMFECFPNYTKIGQASFGAVQLGNAGIFMLKNSKIIISMGTQFTAFKDGRIIERKGIKPDIFVNKGVDAFEIAKEYMLKIYTNKTN